MASSLLLNELPNLEMINRFSNKLIYGSVDSFKELLVDVKNIIFENETSVKEKPKAPPPAIIEKVEEKKEESKEDEKKCRAKCY